ncbi:pEARLI1-like lipid transfer protein 2 [Trematomus bernacchii]|uniref:pEARLI1-like lipid transfer protein 2 n=1 Tax=Trematomus bernacchii TaxID=40690 RepID=UPI00146E10E8|nr:pEARLI1-like lipid transfer protein 2 [Trematomus bernacchii]XP_033973785.1 pEARLI1-like lipid transfer protein 2 [Trematomus bernacchii]
MGITDVKCAPDEPDAGSSGVGGQCTEEPRVSSPGVSTAPPAPSPGVSTAPPEPSPGVSTAPPAPSPGVSTAPPAQPSSSGRVLTDAVLQMQRDTIAAIHEVARQLGQILHVLAEISTSLKDLANK